MGLNRFGLSCTCCPGECIECDCVDLWGGGAPVPTSWTFTTEDISGNQVDTDKPEVVGCDCGIFNASWDLTTYFLTSGCGYCYWQWGVSCDFEPGSEFCPLCPELQTSFCPDAYSFIGVSFGVLISCDGSESYVSLFIGATGTKCGTNPTAAHAIYRIAIVDFDFGGPNVLTLDESEGCENWPATITITPVF